MQKVIIIGTGIVGATTAYLLAKENIHVTMIDAAYDGRATSAGAGIIAPWANQRRNKAWYHLAKEGAAYYTSLIQSLGEDNFSQIGYKKVGSLQLYDSPKRLEKMHGIVLDKRVNAPEIGRVEMLDESATKEAFPYVADGFQSLYIEGAARVDGRVLVNYLMKAAKSHGAVYHAAHAEIIDGNTVSVNGTNLSCDQIILANGVWMNDSLQQLGLQTSFYRQKGQLIHVQLPEVPDDLPVVNLPSDPYIVPFENGRFVIGATKEDGPTMDARHSLAAIHELLDKTFTFAPGLKQAQLVDIRTGFRPFTPSFIPSFGFLPDYESILYVNGLGASGLTTGPYIASLLARMVMGQTLDLDISPYDIRAYLL